MISCALRAWPAAPYAFLLAALFTVQASAREPGEDFPMLSADYVVDVFTNASGGADRGSAVLGKAEARLESSDALLGIEGARASAAIQFTHGRLLSGDLVGDAQTVSNIEALSALRPYEAWVSLPLGGRTLVKAGLIDLNTEFDVQQVGLHFLNSSHGIGPEFSQSGLNGPSIFPTTATGIVVSHAPSPGFVVRAGLFDGVAGDPERPTRTVIRFPGARGLLSTVEIDLAVREGVKVRLGGWRYSRPFDEIGEFGSGLPLPRHRSAGGYAMIEGRLAGHEEEAPVHAWLRWGWADARVNPISNSIGGGVTVGPEGRRWGIAIAHARLGNRARTMSPAGPELDRAETNLELSYAHALGERLTLQPDIQFIRNPGWEPERRDSLVAGIRIAASFF